GGPAGIGRRPGAEPGDRDVDHARVAGGDVVVAQSETVHGPGLEVLGDHVEPEHEVEEELPSDIAAQVEGDAALAEVVAQEGRAYRAARGVEHRRLGRPARL